MKKDPQFPGNGGPNDPKLPKLVGTLVEVCFFIAERYWYQGNRRFIKGRALGKLTHCERDLAINLPSCFVFSSYFLS